MRLGLRGKLALAFLVVALLAPAAALVLLLREARSEFRSDFETRVERVRDGVRLRMDDVARELSLALARVAQDPAIDYLRQDLKWESFYDDPQRERALLAAAEQLMRAPGLDVLAILDRGQSGRVLAMGHRRGAEPPDDVALRLLERAPGRAVFREAAFERDGALERLPTLQVIEAAGDRVVLVGGRIIDVPFLRDLVAGAGVAADVSLVDAGGRLLVTTAEGAAGQGPVEAAVIPLTNTGESDPAAQLRVEVSRTPLEERQASLVRVTVQVGAAAASFALLLGLILARRITRPVGELADAARRVTDGELDVTIPGHIRKDEIGELVAAFNTMTQARRATLERAVRAERVAAWKDMARRIAHEIKNPLFPIQTSIETLKRARVRNHPDFEEIFEESTTTILEEVERMKRIVTEFSRFARLPPPEPHPMDAAALVAQVARLYSDVAPAVVVRAEALGPIEVCADSEQLSQVLGNFVQNAIDASLEAGGREVVVRAVRDGAFIELQVDDDGPGVPPELRERVFDPYYTAKEHGTGLGLAIARRIVTDHGGRVRVDASPAGGARFVARLPVTGSPLREGSRPREEEES